MICPLCEAKIEEGSVYCSNCGKPIQVVPDYNPLEDDFLPEMLAGTKTKTPITDAAKNRESNKFDYKPIVLIVVAFVIVIVTLTSITFYQHSFGHYYNEAMVYYEDEDYKNAVAYLESALEKKADYDAYIALGKSYYKLEEYDKADEAFTNALKQNRDSAEVISLLAVLYDKTDNSFKLQGLFEMDLTDEQKKALEGYESFAPVFSLESGKYDSNVTVELFSADGFSIYYTLDGTSPSEKNGKLYEEPVPITNQGKTTLSAVCINDSGKLSNVASETYEISYVMPATPEISPTGGVITKQTYITVTCQTEGVSIYYTWDDSMPTVDSALYTEPILIPEGNNILSAIAIDEHGMNSDVVKSNYIYYP